MKKLNDEDIKKVADLAMMNLSQEEIEKYKIQVNSILEYVEKLSEINTDDVDIQSHVDLKNVFNEDNVSDSLDSDKVISQTKNKNNYVVISSVVKNEN